MAITSQNMSQLRNTTLTIALATAAIFLSSIIYQRCKRLAAKVRDLEASLKISQEKCAAERQGRIRAQQELRECVTQKNEHDSKQLFYPMIPIGTIKSCFSTRNGTPRQPLVVPLARAKLEFHPSRVSAEALEGLAEFSHCWIIYVFHLNTNLDKISKDPYRSKLKAKVRVPRLKGGKKGVLATRSPHRPCPVGLSVAKIEAVNGHNILLSGVDLVDGTPVLDIKPYLPYSDCVTNATVPAWVQEDASLAVGSVYFSPNFASSLSNCWTHGKQSLYASSQEFETLIKEVLIWDIRSISQRTKSDINTIYEDTDEKKPFEKSINSDHQVIYHLILEGIDISYRINENNNVFVEKANIVLD